jgi:hypothetical protein
MKKLFLLMGLVLGSALCQAQTSEPFKKASTIRIATGLPADDAFVAWGKHLAQNGFTIGETNKDFGQLATNPKDTSKWNYAYVLASTIDEAGVITLKIKWQLKAYNYSLTEWQYATSKNNIQYIIHQDMLPVFSKFGYPVTYE